MLDLQLRQLLFGQIPLMSCISEARGKLRSLILNSD
jgi:hypothetical protein